jgi:predicted Zn finger-like uncharacterized protein
MIIQCQSCASKYFLSEERVPVDPLKVRCPKCRAVFMLAGKRERVMVGVASLAEPDIMESPVSSEPVGAPAVAETASIAPDLEIEPAVVETRVEAAPAKTPVEEAPVAEASSTPAPEAPALAEAAPAPRSPRAARGGKSADDRAKRLARVLVSDILWYNRERRDAALRDGTLMTSLGEEIKKSWELYKEKVGPEAAQSTNYFKEALNEILADGQQVF